MMTRDPRILLPIDLHRISRERLQTVVEIASLMQQGVLGLLLEDLQLQQAAALPFTTEVLNSGRERSLLCDQLARRSERINADTQTALAELAGSRNVDLRFEKASGQRLHCALEYAGDLDVFFTPREQWQTARPTGRRPEQRAMRLLVLSSSGQTGQRVMRVAAALLQAGRVSNVEIIGGDNTAGAELTRIAQPGQRIMWRHDTPLTAATIVQLIMRSPCDLMLIPRELLATIPAADLSAALALARAQILVASAGG